MQVPRGSRASVAALAAAAAFLAACGAPGTPEGASLPPDDRVTGLDGGATPSESPALAEGSFPPDFSIDVTVLLGAGAADMASVQDRQAKYILLADGSLHSDASPFIDVSTRPGRTRWLYEEQVQFVWALCSQLGFSNPADANGPPNPDLLRAAAGERMAIITLRAGGRSWTFVRRAPEREPLDPAAARVIRSLAILSWIPDLRPEELIPERYDFGPDPYAAYREIRSRQAIPTYR